VSTSIPSGGTRELGFQEETTMSLQISRPLHTLIAILYIPLIVLPLKVNTLDLESSINACFPNGQNSPTGLLIKTIRRRNTIINMVKTIRPIHN
jgi:hypothetical protein